MKKLFILLSIALLVVTFDSASKWWIDHHLMVGERIPIIDGIFDIVHVQNRGAAFGLFSNASESVRRPFFYTTSIAALLFLLYYFVTTPTEESSTLAALSLVLGGAIGNVSDRILRGSVVDFLSVHWYDTVWTPTILGSSLYIPLDWPAFNVADSAITVGVFGLLATAFRHRKARGFRV